MAIVSKNFTFSSGATIIASEHNDNFDVLYSLVNGAIQDVNIAGDAAISDTKLDLATIAQNIIHSGTMTHTGNVTFSGVTIADLGTVTTADINGGSLDDMTLGAAVASTITGTTIKADTTFEAASGTTVNEFSIDGTMAGDSDDAVPTEKATKTYADTKTIMSQTSASRQSGTGGTSDTYATVDSVAKTITSGRTAWVMCTLRYVPGTTQNESIKLIHGSTTIQEFTDIDFNYGSSSTDPIMVTLQGMVTGLSGSVTFAIQGKNGSGTGSTYTEVNLTVVEFSG